MLGADGLVLLSASGRGLVAVFQALLAAPSAAAALSPCLALLLLGRRVLVQEEDGPVLAPDVGLVGQHELGQHGLVAADGGRVLVLHDGAAINVERGDEDVLDMVLDRVGGILGAQPHAGAEVRGSMGCGLGGVMVEERVALRLDRVVLVALAQHGWLRGAGFGVVAIAGRGGA